MNAALHQSVLLNEAVSHLLGGGGQRFIDLTLGLGGHAETLLHRSAEARLLGLDRDEEALAEARDRLSGFGDRFEARHSCFSEVEEVAADWIPVDGVLADLGVSSLQLDRADRGFSFRFSGPLDMRMDQQAGVPLQDYLASVSEKELARVLAQYGEVRRPKAVARVLLKAVQDGVETTNELARILEESGLLFEKRIHPATKVFQALRIAVNHELEELETLLEALPRTVRPGGRAVLISFHSLEDRMVKKAFRNPVIPDARLPRGLPQPERADLWKPLFSKPIQAQPDEVDRNPRARSAKLRVAERTQVAA